MCQMFAGQDPARQEYVTRRLRLNRKSTSIRLKRAFRGIVDQMAEKDRSTTANRPGLPGNNNHLVFGKGAKSLGHNEVHTGRMAIQSSNETGARIASQQSGFCLQG